MNPSRLLETLTIQETACLVATARKMHASTDKTVTYNTLRRTTGRAGL